MLPQPVVQTVVRGVLDNGAPIVLNSGPADAVLELKAIVLLMMFTAVESSSEIPAPSQPATLSVMMLLVTVTVFHCEGCVGKATTSEPLTAWKAIPAPLPLSAVLPMMRLALITKPGPTPSLGPTPAVRMLPDCRSCARLRRAILVDKGTWVKWANDVLHRVRP